MIFSNYFFHFFATFINDCDFFIHKWLIFIIEDLNHTMEEKRMSNLIHVTKENFEKEVKNSEVPVILDFWAEWCGPCRMLGPVFEAISSEYTGKLKFAKLNTEKEPELAGSFNIMGIPSLLILKNGEEVNRIVGFLPKEILKQKIDAILQSM